MAQLTEGLVREALRGIDNDRKLYLTINEVRQALYAWLKLNGIPFELTNTAARSTRGVPPEHEYDEAGKCRWCPAERPRLTVCE